ncbi:MAG: DUF362 domain-containing protein [Candidatus Heimdallarchaeota archaeon]|nr:DUF362 domain-containing protein [Candidatus Heimdallarchaeota archaeon]MBY8993893.1 DUF362 domain-containing protein [Candidatus Heimdallarchaeota archaeon]
MPSIVALVKGERGLEPVYRAIDLIPFEEALGPYDTVLVKPNLITSHTYETGITTDPIVVEAIITKVQELGKKAIVVETDGGITSPDDAIHKTGMMEVIERLGSEYINMRKLDEKVELKVANHRAIKKFKVAKLAVDSAIITVPSMKTLHHTSITMGLKNMFGMLTTRNKFSLHIHGMNKVIYDVCKTLPPTLSIIDGFYAKSGGGPWTGDPIKMDTIIASVDPVAADATGARCIGIDPQTIDHVRWLHESGMGEINDIEIVGNNIDDVYQKWDL